uniref:Uncharacterized protein n=1 Tax=Rhizophora mucronata TaxID=61149 RepID=A0A2P2QWT5_RHIMU
MEKCCISCLRRSDHQSFASKPQAIVLVTNSNSSAYLLGICCLVVCLFPSQWNVVVNLLLCIS